MPRSQPLMASLSAACAPLGYAVENECAIGDGFAVDLRAKRSWNEIYLEIETGKSDIQRNIQKCQGLHGRIIFFFTSEELLAKWLNSVSAIPDATALTPSTLGRLPECIG